MTTTTARARRVWARLTGDRVGALTDDQRALYTAVRVHAGLLGVGPAVLLSRIARRLGASAADRRAVLAALRSRR